MAAYSDYFSVVRTTPGQRISAYNQMRPMALEEGFLSLVQYLDRAKAHDMSLAELEARWAAQQAGGLYPPELQVTDDLSDNTLTGIRDVAHGHIRGLPPDAPLYSRVEAFVEDVFPGGVSATTSLRYVDQAAAMEAIVHKLRGEHKDLVDELGLRKKVDYLAELTTRYRTYVDAGSSPMAFVELRASRDHGHQLKLEIVALILGTYCDSTISENVRKRDKLMAPLRKQIEITRAQIRARRSGYDMPEAEEPDEGEIAGALGDAMDDSPIDLPAES